MIRDVGGSYRRALAETVHHFSGWRPPVDRIDALKAEGHWNNDWEAAQELLRRHGLVPMPGFDTLVEVFSGHYFGGDPDGDPSRWRGFIRNEPLLVDRAFFDRLSGAQIAWGFVSGAEPSSARYVLRQRLKLVDPPLIAMGEAPDKPDPTGLLRLAERLAGRELGAQTPTVAYLGDTVADVRTVLQARQQNPHQRLVSLAVAPPHLHAPDQSRQRSAYEASLLEAGADRLISRTADLQPEQVLAWLDTESGR